MWVIRANSENRIGYLVVSIDVSNENLDLNSNVTPEWEERLIDFTFGAMDPEASAEFERELAACTARVTLARQYGGTVAAIGSSVTPLEPPEGHKARFMAKLAATPQATATNGGNVDDVALAPGKLRVVEGTRRPVAGDVESREHGPSVATAQEERIVDLMQARAQRRGSVLAPALAIAAVLALLLMGAWVWTATNALNAESSRRLAAEQKLNELAATLNIPAGYTTLQIQPQAPYSATAQVLYNPNTNDAALVANDLDPLTQGKVYEFWLLPVEKNATPQAAGVFTAEANGVAKHVTKAPEKVGSYAGFAVTLEDAPGGAAPKGPIVLAGAFR